MLLVTRIFAIPDVHFRTCRREMAKLHAPHGIHNFLLSTVFVATTRCALAAHLRKHITVAVHCLALHQVSDNLVNTVMEV